jgi:hypothetical protein
MVPRILILLLLALTGCGGPEPDDAIVCVWDLPEHPGHPCAELLPSSDRARPPEYEAAERCVVDHCVGRVGAMDPERDAGTLRELCLGGFEMRSQVPRGCHLAACERLAPAMPGLYYAFHELLLSPEERERVYGPLAGSSELLAAVLALGQRAGCRQIWHLGSSLTVLQLEGMALAWDEVSLGAARRLGSWEQEHCHHEQPTVLVAMSLSDRM